MGLMLVLWYDTYLYMYMIDANVATNQATAYRASKVVAERAAWDFIRDHEVQYKLITLCPGMVFGTMLHPIESLGQLNVSNGIVWEVLKANHGIPATKAPGLFSRSHSRGIIAGS